ncbi:MAG: hypothetical protein DMG26_19345, partial [Acidobacteria bacterium]
PEAIYPGTVPISKMAPLDVWRAYIRYIGAGAVTMAGLITLARTLPTIVSSFRAAFKELTQSKRAGAAPGEQVERTERDLPLTAVLIGTLVMVAVIWALLAFHVNPGASGNLVSAVLIVIFGFFFSTVSARIVGLIGASSNPISGMTIATLMGWQRVLLDRPECGRGDRHRRRLRGRHCAVAEDRIPGRRDSAPPGSRVCGRRPDFGARSGCDAEAFEQERHSRQSRRDSERHTYT